ncbi:MAG: methyl-accepting chemotaxis protein, partial [Betaproteobacteria bacterium]|nr:methyl-accepting chemotaxis protein [Betaproteobacteria bacterium]
MAIRLSLQQKMIGFGAVGAAFSVLLGIVGYGAINTQGEAQARSVQATNALRDQMDADMMHDALRADVLMAMRAGAKKDAAMQKAAGDDVAEHSKKMREALAGLDKHELAPGPRGAVIKARQPLEDYIKAANDLVAQAAV